jgi:hypothetical protein
MWWRNDLNHSQAYRRTLKAPGVKIRCLLAFDDDGKILYIGVQKRRVGQNKKGMIGPSFNKR